jgi:hypothetical protein
MLGQLIELLQTGLTFGGDDAFGAIEALENIGMSNHRDWDKLEAALQGAAGANPDGDPKDVIVPWLQKDDPEAAAEIQRMTEPQQAQPAEPPMAEDDEDSMDNAEVKEPRQASTREIAETIMSFCNTEDMTFPKGEEGVIIRCGKMYGPRGEALATRLVDDIKQKREAMEAQRSAQNHFEEIRRLAGLVK